MTTLLSWTASGPSSEADRAPERDPRRLLLRERRLSHTGSMLLMRARQRLSFVAGLHADSAVDAATVPAPQVAVVRDDPVGRGGLDGPPPRLCHASGSAMHVWAHDRWLFPLPEHHPYPLGKGRLLRERLISLGVFAAGDFIEAEPARWSALARVHDPGLLGRIRRGELSERERCGLGLPWSQALVERARRVTNGTVMAAREALRTGVAMNLGGGSHHAGRDFARGYCLFNDIALAVDTLREAGSARTALVVDCDVHQGDGTAHLLGPEPLTFTLSLHGASNYPTKRFRSDLDVDLPRDTGDSDYLPALEAALGTALTAGPYDIAFYLAGADPWEGDRLGTLALTKDGLRRRDELVLDTLSAHGIPVCVTLAGGYAPNVCDIVDIHTATVAEVAARAGGWSARPPHLASSLTKGCCHSFPNGHPNAARNL